MTTYYTYDENSKLLSQAKRIVTIDGATIILGRAEDFAHYLSAYPKAPTDSPEPLSGKVAIPDGFVLSCNEWHNLWRYEDAPPPAPRTFSKYKLLLALTRRHLWEPIKQWIVDNGAYDLYLAAEDISEDEPLLQQGIDAIKQETGLTDEQINEILDESVM